MTDEQFEFIMAVNEYKQANHCAFPSYTEILEIAKALGYRKVAAPEPLTDPPQEESARQITQAQTSYQQALERASSSPALAATAQFGLGLCDEELGNLDKARQTYRAVAENPDTTFVLGHAGALQMEQALELCKAYDNVYLELASQSFSNFHRILEEAPPERYLLGSDWPFYHQVTAVAKALLTTEGEPEVRRRLLWENAERLYRFT